MDKEILHTMTKDELVELVLHLHDPIAAVGRKVCNAAANLVEKGWSRYELAHDDDGAVVSPIDERAAAWSMEGALMRASWDAVVFDLDDVQYGICAQLINSVAKSRVNHQIDMHVYNGDPNRKQEQVAAKLREMAA